jgi:hypothetical protein
LLQGVDIVQQMRFKPVGNAFNNYFVDHIAKTYGSVISRDHGDKLFWDENNVCIIYMSWYYTCLKEISY